MVLQQLDIHRHQIKVIPRPHTTCNNDLRINSRLNVRTKVIKFLEENLGVVMTMDLATVS